MGGVGRVHSGRAQSEGVVPVHVELADVQVAEAEVAVVWAAVGDHLLNPG